MFTTAGHHPQSSPSHEQQQHHYHHHHHHSSNTVMTGNPTPGAGGVDYGVRSASAVAAAGAAGGFPSRAVAQAYHGSTVGASSSTAYNSYMPNTAVEGLNSKMFECSDLDSAFLGSGGFNSAGGNDGQMYAVPDRTMHMNSTNTVYGEYGQNDTNTAGFGYGSASLNRSHSYTNSQFSSYNRHSQSQGMNSSVQHSTNADYSAMMMRRMSVPSAEPNVSTHGYARSNSYPPGTQVEDSNTQYPSSNQLYSSMGGYNQTAYPGMHSSASAMGSGQIGRRTHANSYLQSHPSGAVKKSSFSSSVGGNENLTDLSYSMHSSMTKGLNSAGTVDGSSMYSQFQQGVQNSSSLQGVQHCNMRQPGCTYPTANTEMPTNHFSSVTNLDMYTPASASQNYSNKGSRTYSGTNQSRQSSAYNHMGVGHARMPGYKTVTDSHESDLGQANISAGSQRLRHYGPMPNQIQNMHHMSYRSYNTEAGMNTGESAVTPNMQGQYQHYDQYTCPTNARHRARSLDGKFMKGSSPAQSGMATPTIPMLPLHQRPYDSSHQQGLVGHSYGNANPLCYNNRAKSETFSPTSVQTNGSCQEMFNQTYVEGQQRQSAMNNSTVADNNCQPAYQMQTEIPQTEADIRRNMIFSAELEKLARLSRDPIVDNFPGGINAVAEDPQTQDPVGTLAQPLKNPSYPDPANSSVNLNLFNNQGQNSSNNSSVMGKGFCSPQAGAPSINTNQCVKVTSAPSSVTESCVAALSAPSTPAGSTTTGVAQPTPPDLNTNRVQTSAPTNPGTATTSTASSQDKGKDSQNAVQQLQRLTQSLKEKKDEGGKGSHMEYLSHSNDSSSIGGQNCIAALSAACRNMIADMDSSIPKLTPTTHSPLAMKSVLDYSNSGLGQKSTPTPQSQMLLNSQSQMSDQMFSPPSAGSQNVSPPLGTMSDSFGSPPYSCSTSNAAQDYQMQFNEFLEQNVPMQMHTRRPEEKPRKKGKRKKSDEVNDLLTASTIGPKKKRGRKKSQNLQSVESFEQPPSLDSVSASTPLSDGQVPLVDENPTRSATQTPNMLPNFWRTNDSKVNCSESMSGVLLSGHQPPSVESDSATQDFLDSVFSPDTTMSAMNQELVDSLGQSASLNHGHHSPASSLTSQHSMNDTASTGSYSSQGGQIMRMNQNYPANDMDQSKLMVNQTVIASKSANGTVSSTGDVMSNPVSTSSDTTDANSEKSVTEEVHPLEILQAQIQLQRQQFNLNDSRPLPLKNALGKVTGANTVRKTGPSGQGEVDVTVLMAEEDATWYMPSEQPKEPGVPWENTRKNAKGQQQADTNPGDRRTQNKLFEQKRRDTLKNSIDNLKNALPDGRNLTDQTQQSVLLKAQNYIKDMIGKQQKTKTCLEDLKSLKSENSILEDKISILKQEYDILSNME